MILGIAISHNSSKGQIFILASVITVAGVVLIFNMLGSPLITEEKRFQDTRTLNKNARNVMSEYMHAAGIASLGPDPEGAASEFISNFSSYIRDEFDSEIFYAVVFNSGQSLDYSVAVGNYLDTAINVTVNVTDSVPNSGEVVLKDREKSTLYFSSNGYSTINVTVSYRKGSMQIAEEFPVSISDKRVILGFFDITLKDRGFRLNLKDVYNRSW